jgi:methylmalonyl-CoA mutase cobalamin-binding subunit
MVDTGDQSIGLSIGALSNATGVPVETLRTWERRYGFPSPIDRTEGRHRRYSASTVDEVRLALQALDLGHRPSAVLGRSPAQVRELIGAVLLVGTEAAFQPPSSSPQDERIVESWLELTRQSEGERLSHEFSRSMAEIGALEFLERRMGCYLRRVGDAWAAGELRVMHEHLASERAREFLAAQWRTLSERAARPNAPAVVMATPSGERHVLGLHMAAWAVALGGARVVFLGADSPWAEVVFAVDKAQAQGVALSVAAGYSGDLGDYVATLGQRLGAQVSVVAGGIGAAASGASVQVLSSFGALSAWAEQLGTRLDN